MEFATNQNIIRDRQLSTFQYTNKNAFESFSTEQQHQPARLLLMLAEGLFDVMANQVKVVISQHRSEIFNGTIEATKRL